MSAQDFAEGQRRYLEVFVAGMPARHSLQAGRIGQAAARDFIAELERTGCCQADIY